MFGCFWGGLDLTGEFWGVLGNSGIFLGRNIGILVLFNPGRCELGRGPFKRSDHAPFPPPPPAEEELGAGLRRRGAGLSGALRLRLLGEAAAAEGRSLRAALPATPPQPR